MECISQDSFFCKGQGIAYLQGRGERNPLTGSGFLYNTLVEFFFLVV